MPAATSIWSRYANRLFGTARATALRRTADRRPHARRRGFERLEERMVLSASFGSAIRIDAGTPEVTWDAVPAATADTAQPLAATGAFSPRTGQHPRVAQQSGRSGVAVPGFQRSLRTGLAALTAISPRRPTILMATH